MASTGPEIDAFTDGACLGNPGPGGWAALLRWRGRGAEREFGGGTGETTNNRMELLAAIRALEALKRPAAVRLHTDSRYLRDGVTLWLARWRRNGWRTAARKPVRNRDLWERLESAAARHDVEWVWVRGHAGHPENERADRRARAEAEAVREAARRAL